MTDDPRYAAGLAHFRATAFFEAHEELEGVWRATPPGDDRRYLQGMIQLAVSLEHWRRGNPRGARGQRDKALAKLEGLPVVYGGVALGALLDEIAAFYRAVGLDAPAEAVDAPPWPAPRPAEAAATGSR